MVDLVDDVVSGSQGNVVEGVADAGGAVAAVGIGGGAENGGVVVEGGALKRIRNAADYMVVVDEVLRAGADSDVGRELTQRLVDFRLEAGQVDSYRSNRYDDEGMNFYMDLSRDLSRDEEARKRVRERKGEGFVSWWDSASPEERDLVIADGIGRSLTGDPVRGRLLLAERNGLVNDDDDREVADFVRKQSLALDEEEIRNKEDGKRAYMDVLDALASGGEFPSGGGDGGGEVRPVYLAALNGFAPSYEAARGVLGRLEDDGFLGVEGVKRAGSAYIRGAGWYEELSMLRGEDRAAYDLVMEAIGKRVDMLGADNVPFLEMMADAVSQSVAGAGELLYSPNAVSVGAGKMDALNAGWSPPKRLEENIRYKRDYDVIKGDLAKVAARSFESNLEGTVVPFVDEVGGMVGQTLAFFAGGGALSFMSSFNNSYSKYAASGVSGRAAIGAAFGDSLGEWAVERVTFRSLGKLAGGKRFDEVSELLGRRFAMSPVLGRVLGSENVVVRFGVNSSIGYLGEHGEEVVSPYAQWLAGNLFSGGSGMDLADARDQMFDVLSPRLGAQIFSMSAVLSLLGMGANRFQKGRYERAVVKEGRARLLDMAESPEVMAALGLAEAEVNEVRNTVSPEKRIQLLDGYASERLSKMQVTADAEGREAGYVVFAPEQDIVQQLMQERAIDSYVADGRGNFRVSDRRSGEVLVLDKETALARLSKEVHELGVQEQFNMARAVAMNEYVEGMAQKDSSIVWDAMSRADSLQSLQVLSDRAALRMGVLREQGVEDAGSVVDPKVDGVLPLGRVAILGGSARSRLELELNRSADGKLNAGNAVFPALNVRLDAARRVVRFARNEASVVDLIEEVSELYVKDQVEKGVSAEWIGGNLRLVQEELRGQGVRDWKLIEEGGAVSSQMVVEGMSKLVRAVAVAKHNRGRMSEAARRFLAWAEALLSWVSDLVKAGTAFHEAAKAGKIDGNFERLVYEAVGVSLGEHVSERVEAGMRGEMEDAVSFAVVRHEGRLFAPNGRVSNLAEEEYHAARSAAFKGQYGDWEAAYIKRFMEGPVVASIEGKLFDKAGDAGKMLTGVIAEWLKERYGEAVSNPVLGVVRLAGRDVKDSWREGRKSIRAEAFRLAPAIIKEGVVIGHISNYKGKPGLNRLLLAAPVEMDKKKYYGIVALQYNHNSKRMVFHDVYTVEKTMFEDSSVEDKKRAQTLLSHGGLSYEEEQRPVLDKSVEPVQDILDNGLFVNFLNQNDNKKVQQELLKQGTTFREEGQRSKGGENSVEPVLNILRRSLFVNPDVSCRIDENGEPVGEVVREFLEEKERVQTLLSSGASFREEGQRSATDKSVEPLKVSAKVGSSTDGHINSSGADVNVDVDEGGFAVRWEDEVNSYLNASRADSVRRYWEVVRERSEAEVKELERLFAGKESGVKSGAISVLAKARGVIRAAIGALPGAVQDKVKSYKKLLDVCMDMIINGKLDARSKLSEADMAAINMKLEANPELLKEWIGKTTGDMVAQVYRRCSQVINLHVRDELIRDIRRMLREVEPEIDEGTRKYKVGKLGASNTRFLRDVIWPALFSSRENALAHINGLDVDILACFDEKGGLIPGMEEEYHKLTREKMVWENYGALGSSDVHRVGLTHEFVTNFLISSSDAWSAHLAERRDRWKRMQGDLMDDLPIPGYPAELHKASDPDNRRNSGHLVSLGRSVESSIDFLDSVGKMPGMKRSVEGLREKFVHARSLIGAESVGRQRRFNVFLEEMLGTRNRGRINSFLLDWRKQGAFRSERRLTPVGFREVKLPIEKAIEIIEERKLNPFYGAEIYSSETIDLMSEAVNDWVSGKNKARKYITVREMYRDVETGIPAMSKDNALNLLMLARQRNYEELMLNKGYNEGVLKELEEFVGEEGMKLREWLLDEYQREGQLLRPVYEDTYGIPFPDVRNYCPARFYVYDKVSDAELMQLLNKESLVATARSDGFLSVRQKHERNPKTTVGALELFWQHCTMVDNWVYTSELVTDYKAVLSKPQVAEKVVVNIGETDFYELKAFLTNVQNAGIELAAGSVQADKLMNIFAGNVASFALVGRVTSILNQANAVLNGLHGCNLSIGEWTMAMARVVSGKGVISVGDLFNSDLFEWRRDGYAYGNLVGLKKQIGGSWNVFERGADRLLACMGDMDALMNAVSFAAVYDYYFRQAMNQAGMPGVQMNKDLAHKFAMNQVEEGLARAAQPVDWSQKSKFMANAKGVSVLQFMYKGEAMKKLGLVASRFRSGEKWLGVRTWLLCGFSSQLIAYLVQNLCRDDDRDDKDVLSYLPGIVFGPINGIPLFGELLGVPVNKAMEALGNDYRANVGGMGAFAFSYRDIERLFREDKTDLDAMRNKSKGVSASALVLGALTRSGTLARGVTMATAAVANLLEFSAGLLDKAGVQDRAEDDREFRAKQRREWKEKNG